MTLVVLCLAVFTLVAGAVSALVGLAVPALDQVAQRLPGRSQARCWMGIALLPSLLSLLALVAALVPSLGLAPDHCLTHSDRHLHLCARHLDAVPALALWVLAAIVPLRAAYLVLGVLASARLDARTAQSLREGSRQSLGAWVFPGTTPEAFVLGCVRPEIFLSQGLLEMGGEAYQAALAHERDHARHHDSAWRMGFLLLAAGHFPQVARCLARRHALAQEFAADAAAARSIASPLIVADALLKIARSVARAPATVVGFAQGDVPRRVLALLQPPPLNGHGPGLATLGLAITLLGMAVLSHHEIHHGLESLLDLLHH